MKQVYTPCVLKCTLDHFKAWNQCLHICQQSIWMSFCNGKTYIWKRDE